MTVTITATVTVTVTVSYCYSHSHSYSQSPVLVSGVNYTRQTVCYSTATSSMLPPLLPRFPCSWMSPLSPSYLCLLYLSVLCLLTVIRNNTALNSIDSSMWTFHYQWGPNEDQIWEKSPHVDFAARCRPEFVTLQVFEEL